MSEAGALLHLRQRKYPPALSTLGTRQLFNKPLGPISAGEGSPVPTVRVPCHVVLVVIHR